MPIIKPAVFLSTVFTLSACGGGGGGNAPQPAGPESDMTTVSTTGLFSEPRYRFERMLNMDERGNVIETVSRDRYLRPVDDLIYIKRATVLGTDFPLNHDEHFVGKTQEIVKPYTVTARGVAGFYLIESDANAMTLAPYNTAGVKDFATRRVTLRPVDLSGRSVADALGVDFQWGVNASSRMKTLRGSGLTFPAGSQGWLIQEDMQQQDFLYYTGWDVSDAADFTAWRAHYTGASFTTGNWSGHPTFCVADTMPQCVISSGGVLYEAEWIRKPEKSPDVSTLGYYYLNGIAADALESALKAAYK